MKNNTVYFYKDHPLFGIDFGYKTIKIMQITGKKPDCSVLGYGAIEYPNESIKNGEIKDYQLVAKKINELFATNIVGKITTNRVAMSVPATYTFSRIITMPKSISSKDLPDAIINEIQQYLPSLVSDLNIDYSIIKTDEDNIRVLVVAIPKKIVRSYMNLADILNLEVIAIEPTTGASNRVFGYTDQHNVPSVLIDFGSVSSDITIYDENLVVTGTINGGGEQYTEATKNALGVTQQEAYTIKTKYGLNLSKRQDEIREALDPHIQILAKEIRRMIRYYEERASNKSKKIGQVVTMGGGANIPGLSDYLTSLLRLPVRSCDPWGTIKFENITPPPQVSSGLYVTVAGLALIEPQEIFV